ncbi:hypothetical protein O6H91_04G121200 [Diphasiastrum complanatum]|uniref:Uncharacterized protein n=1 Tax=Diphasiastrum complanatum TaxID=34168 RepID=A0ACC2E1M3_DIPCM|nr:hypothetical protein O6H91_04G121200 [Diphasiastrum complanatum]
MHMGFQLLTGLEGMNKAQLVANGAEARICGIQNATDMSKAEFKSVSATKSQTTSNSNRLNSQVPAVTSFSGNRSDYSNQMGDFEKVDMKHSIALSDKPKYQEFSSSAKNIGGIANGRANGTMDNVMQLPSSSASDDDQQVVDERKQKRMLSNRESARRSRQRKQQHLEELREQLLRLRAENSQMLNKVTVVSQQFAQLSQENQFLRIHAMDLSQQLQRLNHDIVTQHLGSFNALDRDIGHFVMPATSTSSVHSSQTLNLDMLPLP